MTDREAMIAVFKAIAKTYERLFSEPLIVEIETENGSILISEGMRQMGDQSLAEQDRPSSMAE